MTTINNLPYLSQRDLKWNKIKIGNSPVDVGHYGCLITCISMISHWFGQYKLPNEIASLKELFTNDGSLIWINLHKAFDKFQFRWREGNILTGDPARRDELIKAYLPGGARTGDGAVILAVANNSHWILPIWFDEYKQDYKCIDPWDGREVYALERYGHISAHAHLLMTGVAKNKLQPEAPNFN